MTISVAVPKETAVGEARVAMVPAVVEKLVKLGVQCKVERGAGEGSRIPDAAYAEAGAELAEGGSGLYGADIVLRVQAPDTDGIGAMREGALLVSFVQAHREPEKVKALQQAKVTSFAMELVPRITRAQSIDALSSQASVAGYRAALMAADGLARFLPMLTTAAGTIRPAKVLVIGAGVAGLQAIATAKRLGAQVLAYDVRTATKEQVESLGAKFLMAEGVKAEGEGGYARELTEEEKQAQQDMLAKQVAQVDAVITTAAIPGKPSPKIISKAMVESMKPGAVIVDLAAEGGGNCELSQPGETVQAGEVNIMAPLNVPSQLAEHASEMYAKNLLNLLQLVIEQPEDEDAGQSKIRLDWEDEVVAKTCLTHDGQIKHEATREAIAGGRS